MSKKKKVSPAKSGKKKPLPKSAKAAAKPVVKGKKVKAATKSSQKVTKKIIKKTTAKKATNKPTSGKLLKKVVKAVKKAVAVAKKNLPGSKAKKTDNQKPKNTSQKAAVSGTKPKTPAVNSKNGADKKLKGHIQVTQPEFKKETRKEGPVAEKPNKKEDASKKGGSDKSSSSVLAITNTIPVKRANEISPSKIASISSSITNPIRKTDSYAIKPEKEPQGKFEMEFVVHSSAEMLYEFLSTPSGLSEWFCDDLNIRNGIYTFIWDDQLQQARLLKTVDLQLVRFQWVDKTDGSYFEFKIQRDDLTNDIALIITDFAETAAERESAKLLWNSQIEKLMHVIGSIF